MAAWLDCMACMADVPMPHVTGICRQLIAVAQRLDHAIALRGGDLSHSSLRCTRPYLATSNVDGHMTNSTQAAS